MTKPSQAPIKRPMSSAEVLQSASGQPHLTLLFYFDPICPWAWRTACWIRDVKERVALDVQWKFFSLATANNLADPALATPLRVLALIRQQGGNAAVENLYFAMGDIIHERGVDIRLTGALDDAIHEALTKAGYSPDLLHQAIDDPSTQLTVLDEFRSAKQDYRAYGVPWLVLGNHNFGFQGPVIDQSPTGQRALELWQHVSWLLAQPYFYELKRER